MAEIVVEEARTGAELIVFPELADSGYFSPFTGSFDPKFAARYHSLADTIPGAATSLIAGACADTGAHVAVGLLERDPVLTGVLYNSMAIVGPDGLIGVYRKVHLPGEEKRYFCAGSEIPVFATSLGMIGLSICYDGRFPELTRTLALRGAEIICSGWAVMEWPGVVTEESVLYRSYVRAQENGVFYLAANRSGMDGDASYLGHSAIAGPNGNILAHSEGRGADVLHAELRAEDLHSYRRTLPLFNDRRPELYEDLVKR